MPATRVVRSFLVGVCGLTLLAALADPSQAGRRRGGGGGAPHEATGFQLFASPQSNPIALSTDGTRVYVANTTSQTVDVIVTASNAVLASVRVGIDPVGVAVRPGANEVWVANHVSDSLSVIDTTTLEVVETVQSVAAGRWTDFDEPVGIAFTADGSKAYVTLSSRNQIAVVDATTYTVTSFLDISAQDPRALAVGAGRLYVAAFESGNQSELAACPAGGPPAQCSLDAGDLSGFATNPNLPNADKDIVIDPDVPDRDLFVFDTTTDTLIEAVTGVGTLLYGIAVDAAGTAYVAQTHARNADNGQEGENLVDLQNRIFDNQIAIVSCGATSCGTPSVHDLEPSLPVPPASDPAADGSELATPYGLQVSDDGSTLVVTAAGSSRLFTFDAATPGNGVLGRIDVGAIPRGVALRSDAGTGAPQTAYVLDTLGNTVTVVDVSSPSSLSVTATIPVGSDPTDPAVLAGRIAFNEAGAASSGTFSCASCHPDGNTDQLLWRIGGPCSFGACSGDDEPRTTMPVRGLANTLPLHWDGTLGDPFGGTNGAVGTGGSEPANCSGGHDCFLQLVGASLTGVMCEQDTSCSGGGELSSQERDDMARFLASVSYPPARSRAPDDVLSTSAADGVADFHLDQGGVGGVVARCSEPLGGCHSLPLGASTNSPVVGAFDAPTMRGLSDRFLQFSLGITNAEEVLADTLPRVSPPIVWDPTTDPLDEFQVFASAFPDVFTPVYNVGPDDIFQMFEEASTGYGGATGRQVTLNSVTTGAANLAATEAIVAELEAADLAGVVNLRGEGRRNANASFAVSFRSGGLYRTASGAGFTRADLIAQAQSGAVLLTLTAELRAQVGDLESLPQPVVSTATTPVVATSGSPAVSATGLDVRAAAAVLVDGQPVSGNVTCTGGTFSPFCTTGAVVITVTSAPSTGLHLWQVQNPEGLLSNELPVCSGSLAQCL